jgi:hypothetical protein
VHVTDPRGSAAVNLHYITVTQIKRVLYTIAEEFDAEGGLILDVADEVVRLPHRLPLALTRLPA